MNPNPFQKNCGRATSPGWWRSSIFVWLPFIPSCFGLLSSKTTGIKDEVTGFFNSQAAKMLP